MRKSAITIAAGALAFACPAQAEVVQSSADGFVVRSEVSVPLHHTQVWDPLVDPAKWWNGDHSWSADAANFSLDARAGGCFCEALPDGGSVEHMRVIMSQPGKMLRLSGALGPLQGEALDGTLTIEIERQDRNNRIVFTYVVGGYSRIPLESVAPAVDGVIQEQANRLAALLFMGDPAWQPGEEPGGAQP